MKVVLVYCESSEPHTTKSADLRLSQEMVPGRNPVLGVATMLHSYDYIALLVPFFNIAMSLGNLFHRLAFVYGRF